MRSRLSRGSCCRLRLTSGIRRRIRADSYPQALACLTGNRAAPPEDCGGPSGYAAFLAAIQFSGHSRHDDLLEWVGGAFDPEAIAFDCINEVLASLV